MRIKTVIGEAVQFGDLRPGAFLYDGCVCFKSEYHTRALQPDAYNEAGEYFWAGCEGDLERRLGLMVFPLEFEVIT